MPNHLKHRVNAMDLPILVSQMDGVSVRWVPILNVGSDSKEVSINRKNGDMISENSLRI